MQATNKSPILIETLHPAEAGCSHRRAKNARPNARVPPVRVSSSQVCDIKLFHLTNSRCIIGTGIQECRFLRSLKTLFCAGIFIDPCIDNAPLRIMSHCAACGAGWEPRLSSGG